MTQLMETTTTESFRSKFQIINFKEIDLEKRGGDAAFATGAFGRTLNRMGNGFAGRGDRYSARYRNSMFGK